MARPGRLSRRSSSWRCRSTGADAGQPDDRRRRRSTAVDASTDTAREVDAETALVAGAPFAQTFMTAPSPGHRRVRRWRTRTTPSLEEYVDAVAAALAGRVPTPSSSAACCSRSTRRTWPGAPHAVRRPAARRVPGVRRAGRRRALNRALDGIAPADRVTAARVLGQLRRAAHRRRPAGDDILPAASTRPASARWCISHGEPRVTPHEVAVLRAPTPARTRLVLVAGSDRHDDATTSSIREVVAERLESAVAARSAIRIACHRRHRLRVRHVGWHRRRGALGGVGRKLRPCAPALTWRPTRSTVPAAAGARRRRCRRRRQPSGQTRARWLSVRGLPAQGRDPVVGVAIVCGRVGAARRRASSGPRADARGARRQAVARPRRASSQMGATSALAGIEATPR